MLGFDESKLTERQARNRAWMTAHPTWTVLGGGLIFGAVGLSIGSSATGNSQWVAGIIGALLGVLVGSCSGWALVQEPKKLAGRERAMFWAAFTVVVVAALVGTGLLVLQRA